MFLTNLRCNGLKNPIGISYNEICFSWEISGEEKNLIQTGAYLQIWDNKECEGTPLVQQKVSGREPWIICRSESMQSKQEADCFRNTSIFQEKTMYFWKVIVYAKAGEQALKSSVNEDKEKRELEASGSGHFMTALESEASWQAKWIEADDCFYEEAEKVSKKFWKDPEMDQGLRRCSYFVRDFYLSKPIAKAHIFITARGLYELKINGKKVGKCALAPDFTPYNRQIYYQTFDIAESLTVGENHMEIIVGDGWYCGHAQGIPGKNHLYGERTAVLAQAEITYADGTEMAILSDKSFQCFAGELLYADLFMGERLDLSQKRIPYTSVEKNYDKKVLVPQKGAYMEVIKTLDAVSVKKCQDGSYLVDFGQVIAGREVLKLAGKAGETIKIERAEELLPDGSLFKIIPKFPHHEQTNYIVFGEDGEISYCPSFSFQGFRYLQISGLSTNLDQIDCKAEVICTAMEDTSEFYSDNEKLNRLVENVKWSQIGNMLSVPTDCPQRERGGFTGDAQVFGKTAAWNQNVQQFFKRWLEACRLEQLPGGQIPIVVPYTESYRYCEPNPGWTSAGWGDVIIFLPWQLYEIYDDVTFLEENFEAMEKWMQYVKRCAEETMPEKYYLDFVNRGRQRYLWNTGYHWGDWQIPGMTAEDGVVRTKEIVASLFYYRAVRVMIQVCNALKRDNGEYVFLEEKIREAFHMEYIKKERLTDETQGNYVIALEIGIVDGELKEKFAERLNQLVQENDYRLQTGFLSTPFLLEVLWKHGYHETAWNVLYQEACPSWFYEVNHGATTVWEEWDAITEKGEYKGSSFNHYAFGAVSDFIYQKIGGITMLENGFRKYEIAPQMHKKVGKCSFIYQSPYGKISVKWEKAEDGIKYDLQIPANTTAVVKGEKEVKELGSGRYHFILK